MTVHLTGHRSGFDPGLTEITRIGEAEHDAGIALSVLVLERGTTFVETAPGETAYLLMHGAAIVRATGLERSIRRASLFDDLPSCLHAGRGAEVVIEPLTPRVELTIYRTANAAELPLVLHTPAEVRNEPRGRGLVRDASFRFVRTIFDRENTHPSADLVLGEVVNLPGRWSSYPPHHHPQPEIYHYRFSAPDGYGHCELGDTVLKVRGNDTVKIFDGVDHPQVAAPGYGMYYSWVIRHLPERRYDVPEFAPEHRWILTAKPGDYWWPRGLDDDDE